MRSIAVIAGLAADEIERRGWVQGELAKKTVSNPDYNWGIENPDRTGSPWIQIPIEDCQVCALGAVNAVVLGSPEPVIGGYPDGYDVDVLEPIADLIDPEWRDKPGRWSEPSATTAITNWNDAPEQTMTGVVSKLREIAAS